MRDLAQVRYVLGKRSGEGGAEQLTHWIATLQFAYVEPSADPKTRRWNPLGFKVIEFKPEPETPPDRAAGEADGQCVARRRW